MTSSIMQMSPPVPRLEKTRTGIAGLDDITSGGLPLGFDIKELELQGRLVVEYIHVDRSDMSESGHYDLEGLFMTLQSCVESVGAKRVAIDTLENLFGGFDDQALLRLEVRRLFRWLMERNLTTVITAERGDGDLTRQGMEEYVSDCVIILDHRIINQISTRRLRVVKYRGSTHGANEYPFLIDEGGICVLPISTHGLDHKASRERISTGIPRLDSMLKRKGYFRGSSILVSGTAGSGKTSIANFFADAACGRGEKALYMAFEESPFRIKRNMESLGLDLERWVDKGLLHFHAARPSMYGLEMHLATIHKIVKDLKPKVVILDPISNLTGMGSINEVHAMLVRLIDYLKSQGITGPFTALTNGTQAQIEATEVGISSLIDTWLLVRDIEHNGERKRLALDAEWAARQAELSAEEADAALVLAQKREALERLASDRMEMARHRKADIAAASANTGNTATAGTSATAGKGI